MIANHMKRILDLDVYLTMREWVAESARMHTHHNLDGSEEFDIYGAIDHGVDSMVFDTTIIRKSVK